MPGQRPAQAAKCAAPWKALISTPISAISAPAVTLSTPGICIQQPAEFLIVGSELLTQSLIQLREISLRRGDALQLQTQHEAVMLVDMTVQRAGEFGLLALHPPLRQSRHFGGGLFPSISARSIARPETPNTSRITPDNLMLGA